MTLHLVAKLLLIGSSAFDAGTSYGQPELNPLLMNSRGNFGVKGISIKGALLSTQLVGQYLWEKKHPSSKNAFTYGNLIGATEYTSVAIRNLTIK